MTDNSCPLLAAAPLVGAEATPATHPCPLPLWQVHNVGDWWEASPDSPYMRMAERAVEREWGVQPLLVREGAWARGGRRAGAA